MSILVLQVITKQWDKGQRTKTHIAQRSEIPDRYSIKFPPAVYAFDKKIIIDLHGDDRLGGRINYTLDDDNRINCDRFQICLTRKTIIYTHQPDADHNNKAIGSLDNKWVQCRYDWRYSVYEGGYYYWLYEAVILNAISVNSLDDAVFSQAEPAIMFEAASV